MVVQVVELLYSLLQEELVTLQVHLHLKEIMVVQMLLFNGVLVVEVLVYQVLQELHLHMVLTVVMVQLLQLQVLQ
jgi:hypothetical protein